MGYTTNDVKTVFRVAPETIRNWTREFSHYLSPTANPESGRTRLFTDDDLKVFDLINNMRDEDKSYEDIHAALKAGERGASPAVSPEEVRAIVTGEIEKQLSLEIQILKRQLTMAEEKVKEFDEIKGTNIRLQAEKDAEARRAGELADHLKDAQEKMESLMRELGRAYHEGYIEGIKHRLEVVERPDSDSK